MLRRPHRPHEDEEEQWEDAEECPHVEVGDVGNLSVRNFAFCFTRRLGMTTFGISFLKPMLRVKIASRMINIDPA